MKGPEDHSENTINVLVSEYEAMSQTGTVGFLEEKVFVRLIEYYKTNQQLDKALEVANLALSRYHYSTDFYIVKANMLLEHHQWHQALDCLEQAEGFAPAELEIHLLRAEAFIGMGYVEDAFAILERLKADASNEELSAIFNCEACIYEHQQKFEQMFYALRDAILADPENNFAQSRLWWCVELSGLYQESIDLHKDLIDINPYNSLAWYHLGHAYSCLRLYHDAAEAFEYAYLTDNRFMEAYKDCAGIWIHLEQYTKAIACLEEALLNLRPDSELFRTLGICYEANCQYDIALSLYHKSLKLEQDCDDTLFRIGKCYLKKGDFKAAIRNLQEAILLDEKKEEYLAALAEAYIHTNQLEKARFFFEKAVETAPEFIQYWELYSSFLIRSGKLNDALSVLDEAECYISGPELMYNRIACWFLKGQKHKALYLFREALAAHFNTHNILFDHIPELEKDQEIHSIIAIYRQVQ